MIDIFNLTLSAVVFIIYSTTSVLCLIFVFSKERYLEIESNLACELFSSPTLSSMLEKDINWFHDWLVIHNRTAGLILLILSVTDLKLCFFIINFL